MEAIVIEENLMQSGQNTRMELVDLRKAVMCDNVSKTVRTLKTGDEVKILNIQSFFHIHSTQCLEITLKKGGQNIPFCTQLLTVASDFDQIVIRNTEQDERKAFIVYA